MMMTGVPEEFETPKVVGRLASSCKDHHIVALVQIWKLTNFLAKVLSFSNVHTPSSINAAHRNKEFFPLVSLSNQPRPFFGCLILSCWPAHLGQRHLTARYLPTMLTWQLNGYAISEAMFPDTDNLFEFAVEWNVAEQALAVLLECVLLNAWWRERSDEPTQGHLWTCATSLEVCMIEHDIVAYSRVRRLPSFTSHS